MLPYQIFIYVRCYIVHRTNLCNHNTAFFLVMVNGWKYKISDLSTIQQIYLPRINQSFKNQCVSKCNNEKGNLLSEKNESVSQKSTSKIEICYQLKLLDRQVPTSSNKHLKKNKINYIHSLEDVKKELIEHMMFHIRYFSRPIQR